MKASTHLAIVVSRINVYYMLHSKLTMYLYRAVYAFLLFTFIIHGNGLWHPGTEVLPKQMKEQINIIMSKNIRDGKFPWMKIFYSKWRKWTKDEKKKLCDLVLNWLSHKKQNRSEKKKWKKFLNDSLWRVNEMARFNKSY